MFFALEQPQVLLAYFKQIKKAKKQSAKWNVSMLDDDIIIHVVGQMCWSDWLEMRTKWEESNKNTKTWKNCQKLFKEAYIAHKRYNDAKGQTQVSINNVGTKEWNM